KMCIHPNQIPVVNRVFTPSAAEIAFAERVVDAFARAERAGSAAIQVDGKFIDDPIVYGAQRLLEKVAALRARAIRPAGAEPIEQPINLSSPNPDQTRGV